jgi:hypothetical protein
MEPAMRTLPFTRHFLRRKDKRHLVNCPAMIEHRGISHNVQVVDFSSGGLRIDRLTGLAVGDRITITFTPEFSIEGTIAWLVWHKAGVRLARPFSEEDPVYQYLVGLAATVEHTHVRAIAALAQQEAIKSQQTDIV